MPLCIAPWHNDATIQGNIRERYLSGEVPQLIHRLEQAGLYGYEGLLESTYDLREQIRKVRTLTLESNLSPEDKAQLSDLVASTATSLGAALISISSPGIEELNIGLSSLKEKTGDAKKYMNYNATPIYRWLVTYMINIHQGVQSDNLGEVFSSSLGSHSDLDGLSISQLREYINGGKDRQIVIASAASSGVIEAGMIVAYLNSLGIRSKLCPVFINHGNEANYFLNPIGIGGEDLIIPQDDQVNQATGITARYMLSAISQVLPAQTILRPS